MTSELRLSSNSNDYLSDKPWVLRVRDVILPEVSMKPVTEIQKLVIQRQQDIRYQT